MNINDRALRAKKILKTLGFEKFERLLVTLVTSGKGHTYLIPDSFSFAGKVQKGYLEELPNASDRGKAIKFNTMSKFCMKRERCCVRFPEKTTKCKLSLYLYASKPIVLNIHTTQNVDEDETVICVDHVEKRISKCDMGDNILHHCDRDSIKQQSILGVASAFIVVGFGDNNFL